MKLVLGAVFLAVATADPCPWGPCLNSQNTCIPCNKSPWYDSDGQRCVCGSAQSDWIHQDQCKTCGHPAPLPPPRRRRSKPPSARRRSPTPQPTRRRSQQNDICISFHGTECTDHSVTGHKTVWTSEACCQACQGQAGCRAWSWNFKDGHCHLKDSCSKQSSNPDYHSGMTDIAEQANAGYNQDNNGVYLRMVHPDLSALDEDGLKSRMVSWVLLNNYAVGDNVVQLYKDGGRPAILAKPQARKHVKCQYPCDGDSDGRHYSCPVPGCPCDTSGQNDFCDHAFSGPEHKPCAFKGDETAKMMEAFKDVQNGKSPLLQNKACGYYHIPGQSHNEAVMDSRTWNKYIKWNLWAVVVTDACKANPACYQGVQRLYQGYKAKYGNIPVLYLNRHDVKHPFHHLSLASETVAAASEEEDEATTNSFTWVGSNMSTVLV